MWFGPSRQTVTIKKRICIGQAVWHHISIQEKRKQSTVIIWELIQESDNGLVMWEFYKKAKDNHVLKVKWFQSFKENPGL